MKTKKTTMLRITAVLLCVLMLTLAVAACEKTDTEDSVLWENATYTEDTTLGEGAKTILITVEAGEKSIELTIKTDKEILGDALMELGLIEGDVEAYGLYVKVVNGIRADYDTDKAYWSLNRGGEYMMSGVDSTTIAGGEHYELVYTK